MDDSIVLAIENERCAAIEHHIAVFLETKSDLLDISQWKFKGGWNPWLQNSIPYSITSGQSHWELLEDEEAETDGEIVSPHNNNKGRRPQSWLAYYFTHPPDFDCSEIFPEYMRQICPLLFLSTIPCFREYSGYLEELQGLRNWLVYLIEGVVRILSEGDWRDSMDNSLKILMEHRDTFQEISTTHTKYFQSINMLSNAFLLEREIHFLQQAADRFQVQGKIDLYDLLMDILSAQPRDPGVAQELLTTSYLHQNASKFAGLHMLWTLDRSGNWW